MRGRELRFPWKPRFVRTEGAAAADHWSDLDPAGCSEGSGSRGDAVETSGDDDRARRAAGRAARVAAHVGDQEHELLDGRLCAELPFASFCTWVQRLDSRSRRGALVLTKPGRFLVGAAPPPMPADSEDTPRLADRQRCHGLQTSNLGVGTGTDRAKVLLSRPVRDRNRALIHRHEHGVLALAAAYSRQMAAAPQSSDAHVGVS